MANTFELIEAKTLTTSAASITFSSIPATYTDLVIKYSLRDSQTGYNYGGTIVKFNGSSSGYSERLLYGNGTTAYSVSSSGTYISFLETAQAGATASTFANGEIYIPNYLSSNYKSVSSDVVTETNATDAYAGLAAHLWSNTAAITSVSIAPTGGTFVTYSTAYLYGIKNS